MNLQEQLNRMKSMMGVMNKKIPVIQKLIDSEIKSLKNICENMNSESEEVISFDACDFLDILDDVSVQDVYTNNNVVVIKILIKYSSVFEYVDEDAFILELSYNLKKYIPKLKFEIESINTKERNW
jgi:hypothetical protein